MRETIQEQQTPNGRFTAGNTAGSGHRRHSMANAQGLAGKSNAILAKIDQGKITPADGAALLTALSSCTYQSDLAELAGRVTALEARQ